MLTQGIARPLDGAVVADPDALRTALVFTTTHRLAFTFRSGAPGFDLLLLLMGRG